MKSFAWLRARPKTLASIGAVTVAAVTIGVLALTYEGEPTTEVDLNDGGVWLTKQTSLLVGHFNNESRLLDGGLRTLSPEYDIQQAGNRVLVTDQTENTATAIDPARVVLSDSADLPSGAQVILGGPAVAVLDESGALRAAPFTSIGAVGKEAGDPIAELGRGAVATVSTAGVVYAVSPKERMLYAYAPGADGTFEQTAERELEGVEEGHEITMTSVGGVSVVLDRDTSTLYTSDGQQMEAPADAVLQQPSNATDAVTMATATGLLRQPLAGGDPTIVDASAEGAPSQPVYVAGCAYGAWSGSGAFVRDCRGEASDLSETIEGIEPTSDLRFRVNRDVVVLNDVFGGAAWMASDALQQVDNWEDITPPEGEGEEEEETTEETIQSTLPERTENNTPPVAEDDRYGVRPGRTTVLPILENDLDADGDVLVAEVVNTPSIGEITPIYNGTALQIALPEDATGTTSFTYKVSDGRKGEDTARVDLTVRPLSENSPPVQKRKTAITVEQSGVVSYNVLTDWVDPDGDDIFLQSVSPDGGDEAEFTSDGQITYRAIGGMQGRKDVPVSVSDGVEAAPGVARYEIRPLGTTLPVTNADHVVTRPDRAVTVRPLSNDTSTGSEQLRLTRVDDVDGGQVTRDYPDKSFTFESGQTGTYYATYLASAGANSAPGIVRIDVLPEEDADVAPIAVRDVALLPAGGDALVNVLGNDTDPAGGILVVQSVGADDDSGVAAAVLGHETIRVSDQGSLDKQVRVRYTISNGSQSADGEIIVIPVPAPEKLRPPIAVDDEVVVRVGDIATIPVMDNDYHPNNDEIHIVPELVPPLVDEEDGDLFVSEDTLRFRAGPEAKTVNATYEVEDSTGQRDAGYVTIRILARDDEANAAPRPRDVTVRTLAGSGTLVPIELDGIDADGDSVELVGLASSPSKGAVTDIDADSFVYTAFDDSTGVDRFQYRVRDNLGKEATALVEVGIAPAESTNQAPYAVRDSIVMRPGRTVAVDVLQNDSDPDGDDFNFAEDAIQVPDVPGLDAEVSGSQLLITAPDEPMQTSVTYTIADERGLRATTSVQITVDPDVPLARPIARDDRVRPEDVAEDGTVTLDVLENDDDPDGTREALIVSLSEGGADARVTADGRVSLSVTDERQLITYVVQDEDDQVAAAFIHVPALADLPPTLLSTDAVEVKSGETIELPLSEYVRASGGREVVITETEKVIAAHSNGGDLVRDERTLTYTSADRYFGADALTFEVTDGTGPDDPEGRKATLTIPITVLPPDNQPPEMAGATMNVAPGEDPATLGLRELATDPDPGDLDDLTFSLVSDPPAGVNASVDGQTLQVSAQPDVAKGTRFTLDVQVTDNQTEPVVGTIQVAVTASTRELPSVNDDIVAQADQGETVSVGVLGNDVNPFPDTPLEIVGTQIETGAVTNVDVSGGTVRVTTASDFVGSVVVRYTVQDATQDADRQVDGRIRITVQGRPDAPGKPTVTAVESRTVVLSWTPPVDNGRRIETYTVRSTAGGYTRECPSTTCTLDGLTNNVEYNFTVTATNSVGESDPSVPSETARPDVRPDQPAPPTLTFGDRSLDVAWTTPRTEGSPVESFTLEISPAPPSGVAQRTGVTGNSTRWDGLENGTEYQVRVRAHNRAPEPSDFSQWSAGEIPAAPPAAPGAPTVARLQPVGDRAQMQVSWNEPGNNGDAIAGYQLNVIRGGQTINVIDVPAGQTSQAVTVDTSTSDYTYSVRARNKAGWGETSPQSAPRRAFTPPGAPTGVTAREGDNRVTVQWQPGASNGANANEIRYQYSVNGNGWRADWVEGGTSNSGTIGNGTVNNGGTYSVRVRAVATADGTTYEGAASGASNQVRPYGQIGAPRARANAGATNVDVSWDLPASNGRPVSGTVRITGAVTETFDVNGGGSRSYNPGYEKTIRIEVVARADGSSNTSDAAQATTQNAPQPRVWVTQGGAAGNCVNGCRKYNVHWENLDIGSRAVTCVSDNDGGFSTYQINFNGRGNQEIGCYVGRDGQNVWVDIQGWGDGVDTEKTFWPRP
ncbi:tandem-95 repeat protein [Microbacterium sp. EYE_5]|uniref:Ig-like domain-containing protein n=1 Tax=unclassified Microbacterium TaxID=2609290 RepID=UPI00200363A8|nr:MULTISPECIES: Ig-like domain-containing protein [unclassified Microbacterium]MCK6079741.1 tandem-95 repeat protein [Microbacterium sp. EYE_382]MCK6085012.1 tandem-95 repeat protein [Microbacterium sp. EYE_384]MCK6122762.1 tandem-95 repeat protein [Microbacterium sp. EYE_80]MCK6125775.1 tandem-95 repeat protein [Microbacterium sp. EYE_79]MCK6140696.1 tandem-95 repeat protein [Microbacterium sp. EYE_39]